MKENDFTLLLPLGFFYICTVQLDFVIFLLTFLQVGQAYISLMPSNIFWQMIHELFIES